MATEEKRGPGAQSGMQHSVPTGTAHRVKTNLTLDPNIRERALALAVRRRISLSALIESVLERELESAGDELQLMAANRRR